MGVRLSILLAAILLSACTPHGMIRVGSGSFYMGTDRVDEDLAALNLGLPEPWYADEHPYHRVSLPGFSLDRTEVTQAAYQNYIDAHPDARVPDDWAHRRHPAGHELRPVTYVNWYDATHYCHWRGGRLPTEAEWEKAARGTAGQIYPWGNTFDRSRAHVSSGPYDRGFSQPVGTRPAGNGPYGHADLIGNVWEWVDTDYAAYPGSTDEVAAFAEPRKAMRGLSFEAVGHFPTAAYHEVVAISARSSFRGYDDPGARLRDVGFRCAQGR